MRRRIFVLDDDQKVLELMTLILEREGHQVRAFTSYESAMESLIKEPADLLVSDLAMPGVGGIEGIRSLSQKGLVRRALIVSGFIDADAEARMGEIPEIVGYIQKPFDIHELARIVRRHVE